MQYLNNLLTNFDKVWYVDAYLPSQPDGTKLLKIQKSKMADGGHLENRKNVISPKPFG